MNFNPEDLLKNISKFQSQAGDIQEKLKQVRATGAAGGDLVQIEMNGQMDVLSVKIDPIAVDPRDVQMLEDLILSSFIAASNNVKEKIKEELSGMGLPAGVPGLF